MRLALPFKVFLSYLLVVTAGALPTYLYFKKNFQSSEDLFIAFRNSQATAVSMALLLSLVAAYAFLRPLQKIARAADSLAKGDYTLSLRNLANDEIGDVGRSLTQMSVQVRRRLAFAEGSEGLLIQLVQMLDIPIAVFDVEGKIFAQSGSAREVLHTLGVMSEDNLGQLVHTSAYRQAISVAEQTCEPAPLRLDTFQHESGPIVGYINILKRPERAPFVVFIGSQGRSRPRSLLPSAEHVQALLLEDILKMAIERATPVLSTSNITIAEISLVPALVIADVSRRTILALTLAFEGAVPFLTANSTMIQWTISEEAMRVGVVLHSAITLEAQEIVRLLLDPLGGELVASTSETCLWLPKA